MHGKTYDRQFYGHRVRLLSEGLSKSIIQATDVLEPILVLWMPEHEIFGAIRTIFPIRDCNSYVLISIAQILVASLDSATEKISTESLPLTNFRWPAILYDNLKSVRSLRGQLNVVGDRTFDSQPIPAGIGFALTTGGKKGAGL